MKLLFTQAVARTETFLAMEAAVQDDKFAEIALNELLEVLLWFLLHLKV
jgi:AMMECR1 domain-containing protein